MRRVYTLFSYPRTKRVHLLTICRVKRVKRVFTSTNNASCRVSNFLFIMVKITEEYGKFLLYFMYAPCTKKSRENIYAIQVLTMYNL